MVSDLLKKGSSLLGGELGPYLFIGCYTITLAEVLSSETLFLGNYSIRPAETNMVQPSHIQEC